MPAPEAIEPSDLKYRPLSGRRRLGVTLLAAATVVTLWWLLLYRPGAIKRVRVHVWPAPCASGQTTDCIGGQSNVIAVLPSAAGPASTSTGTGTGTSTSTSGTSTSGADASTSLAHPSAGGASTPH